jgi:hypothetical protein
MLEDFPLSSEVVILCSVQDDTCVADQNVDMAVVPFDNACGIGDGLVDGDRRHREAFRLQLAGGLDTSL